MADALSPDEHTARAMLLGRIYIHWAHIYVDEADWDRVTPLGNGRDSDTIEWLDADTLSPLSEEEKFSRLLSKTRLSLQSGDKIQDLARNYGKW
jgi:hypothetical protein